MNPILKSKIKKLLAMRGYELNHIVTKNPVFINSPIDAIYTKKDIVFNVEIDKVVNVIQFPFSETGNHPFVNTLLEYSKDGNLKYEKSYLKSYYENFQPESLFDIYIEDENLDSKLRKYSPYYSMLPWELEKNKITIKERGLSINHGSQNFGPVSDKKGLLEFDRLISVYNSIDKNGYAIGKGISDYNEDNNDINGYFLKKNDEYRFVVISGNHRMAALSALNYKKIRVKFNSNRPRVINFEDIDSWPQVKYGVVEKEIAALIFNGFFVKKKPSINNMF